MISISKKRFMKLKEEKALTELLTELLKSKKSKKPALLILTFNVMGEKQKVLSIESVENADKLLSSKYLKRAKNHNCLFPEASLKGTFFAYKKLAKNLKDIIASGVIHKWIEIEFKDEHVFSIMPNFNNLNKRQYGIPDAVDLDIPPVWYTADNDILNILYGNKSIKEIEERQSKVIKETLKDKGKQ